MISKYLSVLIYIMTALIFFNSSACTKQKVSPPTNTQEISQTPTDKEIEEADQQTLSNPNLAKTHIRLAIAYLKKIRETGDNRLIKQAEKSLQKALEIEPTNFAAQILQTQIYLSQHKFQEALDLTRKLEKQTPGNYEVYLWMTDALIELGKYNEAGKIVQKLVEHQPNAASYARVAYLRTLYGDVEGAIEARKVSLKIAETEDKEVLAWYQCELANMYWNSGNFVESEKTFDKALEIFPDYHWALAGKGKLRAANGDYQTAILLYENLYEKVPQVDRTIFLGNLYKKIGNNEKAQQLYDLAIKQARESATGDMQNIAHFWADHDRNLDDALEIAKLNWEKNPNLAASDTFAWCLFKKGKFAEAKKYMEEALRLQTKNALFYFHLGMIENALGNRLKAIENLELALKTNPAFDVLQAETAKLKLAELK